MTYPDEEKEGFYESLKATIDRVPRSDKLIVLGDFNARVGRDHETWERVIGHHDIGSENANGSLLLNMCAEHQLTITNTLYQQANKYKASWMHPRSKHWHLIDYVIVRQRDPRDVKSHAPWEPQPTGLLTGWWGVVVYQGALDVLGIT